MPKNTNLHPAIHKVKYERTFCMIKPDGVMRGLVGEIIHRLEKAGLKVVAMKMLVPSEELVKAHYPSSDEAWVQRLGQKSLMGFDGIDGIDVKEAMGSDDEMTLGQGVVESLVHYMQSGPVVAMVVEGIQAVDMVRKLAGHTLPFKADVGTIRGDFSVDSPSVANVEKRSIHNLFHASETQAEAEKEMKLWFGDAPIYDYDLGNDAVMYSKYY
ncbi:MAG TPA: nucleoside-diphosphate kinase [Candidatus Saccharimonadales bacterium]|nr:nucleoside-diphosphate kinase [Candidatus Saccharimonadales bacterium]